VPLEPTGSPPLREWWTDYADDVCEVGQHVDEGGFVVAGGRETGDMGAGGGGGGCVEEGLEFLQAASIDGEDTRRLRQEFPSSILRRGKKIQPKTW